ncbi:hypothetical protein AWV80_17300 [Cupriavidus sp. UYMU48A]|nr:hypothetical protein AWV80_17300 [Cupriavidus sp. UYMU48A]
MSKSMTIKMGTRTMSKNDESSSANNVDELADSMAGMIKALSHLFAPETLYQSILQGWFGTTDNSTITNITNNNAIDPEMEREITRLISYGHQMGRIIDALVILVKQQPDEIRKEHPGLQRLIDLSDRIVEIKAKTLTDRLKKAGLSPDAYGDIIKKVYSSKS